MTRRPARAWLHETVAASAGFAAMCVLALLAFFAAYGVLGEPRAFVPGSAEPSRTWLVTSCVLGFGVALAGGFTCARIRPGWRPLLALTGAAVGLGLVRAWLVSAGGESLPSAAPGVGALLFARAPGWMLVADPAMDALGIPLGGLLAGWRARRDPARDPGLDVPA